MRDQLNTQDWRIIRTLGSESAIDRNRAVRPSRLGKGRKHLQHLIRKGFVASSKNGYYLSSKGYEIYRKNRR